MEEIYPMCFKEHFVEIGCRNGRQEIMAQPPRDGYYDVEGLAGVLHAGRAVASYQNIRHAASTT